MEGHCADALFHDGKVYRAVCGAVPACAVCGRGAHCAPGHCHHSGYLQFTAGNLFPVHIVGETTQEVLSAYVSEFNDEVNAEFADHAGYDTSEKIYVNYEGQEHRTIFVTFSWSTW